jgi:hypothetical protein
MCTQHGLIMPLPNSGARPQNWPPMHGLAKTAISTALIATLAVGCASPKRLSDDELSSLGVRNGVPYWEATSRLARQRYTCSVSGRVRENFDCTKTSGFMPTCQLRIVFSVDEDNRVVGLRASDPACIGTP